MAITTTVAVDMTVAIAVTIAMTMTETEVQVQCLTMKIMAAMKKISAVILGWSITVRDNLFSNISLWGTMS